MIRRLIHVGNVRALILAMVKAHRPGWQCERVSQEAIDGIEAHIRRHIETLAQLHPTVGKTFKP
jgi:hypothetical protein